MEKVFINAGLSTLAEQNINNEIVKILEEYSFDIYNPLEEIPPGTNAHATDILTANKNAIDTCDILLSVLDKPGLGVVFELGYAYAQNKKIVIFRSDLQDYLGKIIEGIWDITPNDYKARTLNDLSIILKRIREE